MGFLLLNVCCIYVYYIPNCHILHVVCCVLAIGTTKQNTSNKHIWAIYIIGYTHMGILYLSALLISTFGIQHFSPTNFSGF